MQAGALLLRHSSVKLQEELRKANNCYVEEKAALRCQLSGLRLDLSELHRDDRTVTTDDGHSKLADSMDAGSDSELKRLEDFDPEGRSLQLPAIKTLHFASGRGSKGRKPEPAAQGQVADTARSNKTLRFDNDKANAQAAGHDQPKVADLESDQAKQEKQKFLELQKNQQILRNIGRANFKEKRHSLIRLATISSAKKRNTSWDSGNNVCRPKGTGTGFNQNNYVEDSLILSKRAFKIPSIKDSQRSEIHLAEATPRPALSKRKVQFVRPREQGALRGRDWLPPLDVSGTEASSLDTSMADISLEDNTTGNITFDEDAFHSQLADKRQPDPTDAKPNKRHHKTSTTGSPLQPIVESEPTAGLESSPPEPRHGHGGGESGDGDSQDRGEPMLPPVKIKTLAKKNLILHDMNSMRTSPVSLPKLNLSPDNRSVKDSDKSTGSKFSRLSQETESWKSTYVGFTDPGKRNKTLTEIMFAVRSRMRENEETIRFGETPRRRDRPAGDSSLYSPRTLASPRWSDNSYSPRKGKVSKRGRPTILPTKAEKASRRVDKAAHLQGYLRKMCRQRRTGEQQEFSSHQPRAVPKLLLKQPQLIPQYA